MQKSTNQSNTALHTVLLHFDAINRVNIVQSVRDHEAV